MSGYKYIFLIKSFGGQEIILKVPIFVGYFWLRNALTYFHRRWCCPRFLQCWPVDFKTIKKQGRKGNFPWDVSILQSLKSQLPRKFQRQVVQASYKCLKKPAYIHFNSQLGQELCYYQWHEKIKRVDEITWSIFMDILNSKWNN